MVLTLGDQREPRVKTIQSGGRPGAGECRCGRPGGQSGLKPTDPDPAVRAIAPNRSELNRCRPKRTGPEPRKTRRVASAAAPGLKRCGGQTAEGVP